MTLVSKVAVKFTHVLIRKIAVSLVSSENRLSMLYSLTT